MAAELIEKRAARIRFQALLKETQEDVHLREEFIGLCIHVSDAMLRNAFKQGLLKGLIFGGLLALLIYGWVR